MKSICLYAFCPFGNLIGINGISVLCCSICLQFVFIVIFTGKCCQGLSISRIQDAVDRFVILASFNMISANIGSGETITGCPRIKICQ